MRVYYLTEEKFALKNISEKRMKISLLGDLNDPFELMGAELSSLENRNAFNLLKETVSESWGVTCFTRSWANPLMWSHYGDKHKGICLGFDVQNGIFDNVKYRKKRKRFSVDMDIYAGGVTEELIKNLLKYKYIGWEYEKEVRAWANLEEKDSEGLYFMDFDSNIRLREIILGPRSELRPEEVIPKLSGYKDEITVIKSRLAFNSFTVVKNKAVKTLTN